MKKIFILLMVVIMLAGLTFTTFARQNVPKGNGDCDRLQDGSCSDSVCPNPDCPNPDECIPIGDGPHYRGGK